MFRSVDVSRELAHVKVKDHAEEEAVVQQAHRILREDLFSERKILDNLKGYQSSFSVVNEEDLEDAQVFSLQNIEKACVLFRMKFLNAAEFRTPFPYEALLKIKEMNARHRKDLKDFHVLSLPHCCSSPDPGAQGLLFVRTNHNNYYLLHRWGAPLHWSRKLKYWPMRSFEHLAVTVILCTLAVTLSLPTALITLDSSAEYWSGYRVAAFFHLLIFFAGFTIYIVFAFFGNFSNVVWNRRKDFG
jgi:hypothetical protein